MLTDVLPHADIRTVVFKQRFSPPCVITAALGEASSVAVGACL